MMGRADRIFALGRGARPRRWPQAVKAQVYAVDPGQPVMEVKSMEALLAENAYARPRFNLLLFAVFAVLGLVLALFGIYGVISQFGRATDAGDRDSDRAGRQFPAGDRHGAGHRRAGCWRSGVAVGLAASLASVKLLSGLVQNVSTFDPYSFAAVAVLLFAAGIFASFWPARRAARVDPITALRDE